MYRVRPETQPCIAAPAAGQDAQIEARRREAVPARQALQTASAVDSSGRCRRALGARRRRASTTTLSMTSAAPPRLRAAGDSWEQRTPPVAPETTRTELMALPRPAGPRRSPPG